MGKYLGSAANSPRIVERQEFNFCPNLEVKMALKYVNSTKFCNINISLDPSDGQIPQGSTEIMLL